MTPRAYAESNGLEVKTVLARLRRTGNLEGVNAERVNKEWVLTPIGTKTEKSVNTEPTVNTSAAVTVNSKFLQPDSRFEERGRGIPVNGMVKVNVGGSDDRMVAEDVWREQMSWRCVAHKRQGWCCTQCLNDSESIWERTAAIRR